MRVSRTNYVSPSKAAYFYECKYRFIAETERLDISKIPANPAAFLGSAVHSTIEYYLENEKTSFSDIVQYLQKRLIRLIDHNALSNKVLSYVCATYGVERVISYTRIGNASRYIDRMLSEFGMTGGRPHVATKKTLDENYIGSEKPLSSDKLQIAGKPDLTYVDQDGSLIVADFKTGKIRTDGEINRTYLFQVACYGAILKELTSRADIKLRLIGSDEDWMTSLTPDFINEVFFFSQRVKREMPLNVIFDSSDITTLCGSCPKCSIRPNCPKYTELLGNFHEKPSDYINPHDVCGRVTHVGIEDNLYTIRMIDPAGQQRQITSIPKGVIDSKVEQDSVLYFYNLKTRETTARSKLVANFHVIDKQNPENTAFQVLVRIQNSAFS